MSTKYAEATGFHRLMRQMATKRPITWLYAHMLHHLDGLVLRGTNGRYTATSLMTGLPIINLTTIGAKSGRTRTVPLLGIPDGDNIIVIASNWGQKQYPAWYYNVKANEEVMVEWNGRSTPYLAQETTGTEREKYWQLANQYYLGYANYAQRASHRHIPVIVLTPE
ncbi:MAG: nitroreductase family deazaflavin-dependent oxidoreductase [Ardenticatenaceae bacterium]|nr:nitroreductase family deazaflavin-dependent oxidoreductase [Ardenticatenaceae bacterium]